MEQLTEIWGNFEGGIEIFIHELKIQIPLPCSVSVSFYFIICFFYDS